MKKMTHVELEKLKDKWKRIEEDVEVTDFESAIKRCEQLCAKNYIQKMRKQKAMIKQRERFYNIGNINEKERLYRRERYKINGHTRKFIAIACQKYGSLSMYHFSKIK